MNTNDRGLQLYWRISLVLALVLYLVGVDSSNAAAIGTTYYVDNTNASCSDTGSGTSTSLPFCTIAKGASMAVAGDTIRVLAGSYAETVSVPKSGTSGLPITYSAASGVILRGNASATGSAFRISSKSYITINGFTITGTVDRGIYVSASNNITISNNHISYSGSPASGYTRPGVYITSSTNSTITGNTFDHNSSHGIQLINASNNNLVSNNIAFANAQQWQRDASGIRLDGSTNNTILHNITYGNEDSGVTNYTGASGNSLIGNLTYGNGDHGIDNYNSSGNILIGNTAQGNHTAGFNFEGTTAPASSGGMLRNNISVDNGINPITGQKSNIRVDVLSVPGTTIDYDIVYLTGAGTVQIQWNGTNYATLAAFKTAVPGQEVHGIQADPLFVSPVAYATRPPAVVVGDFHIKAGSPAIDSAYADAPGEPLLDLDGNARIDDPAITNTGAGTRAFDDRGVYEFQPVVGAPTPTNTSLPTATLTPVPQTATFTPTSTATGSPINDEIHWTITGPNSVSLDWRGPGNSVSYGLTTSYGQTVMASAPSHQPFSSAGPFWEARIANLQPNTTYHYSIGGSSDYTFKTALSTGNSGFTVDVIGDIGSTRSLPRVGPIQAMIATDQPNFVLAVGDLTYGNPSGQAEVDQHFNDVQVWSLGSTAYMPAWGNHEWDNEANDNLKNYKGRFDLPNPQTSPGSPAISCCGEDWYYFDYGNVRFIAYPEPFSGAWSDWNSHAMVLMDEAQADPAITFIVTFGHRPAYSSGYHSGDTRLQNYLDALGASHSKYVLNLNGHSHNYERTYPQSNVVHITEGTGGSSMEQTGTCLWAICTQPSWSAQRYMHLGVVKLTFTDHSIQGAFICGPAGGGTNDINCTQGTVIDSFTISDSGSTPTATNTSLPPISTFTPTLIPTDTPLPTATATVQLPTFTPTDTSLPTATLTSQVPTSTPTASLLPTATATVQLPTFTPTSIFTPTPTLAAPSSLTVIANADSYVFQTGANSNYGTNAQLWMDGDIGASYQAYLKFSVSGTTGSIRSAILRVYSTSSTVDGPTVYATTNSWTETGITWNTQPALTSSVLDDRAAISTGVWTDYNVTAQITGNGTYSFVLVPTSTDAVSFSSREGAQPPQLILTIAP